MCQFSDLMKTKGLGKYKSKMGFHNTTVFSIKMDRKEIGCELKSSGLG
jgi:hypothetical protein